MVIESGFYQEMEKKMKSGMKVYCVTMDKNFVVGLVSKNGDILCIDIFNTDKEDNFDTYWVDKRNLQIGWKQ